MTERARQRGARVAPSNGTARVDDEVAPPAANGGNHVAEESKGFFAKLFSCRSNRVGDSTPQGNQNAENGAAPTPMTSDVGEIDKYIIDKSTDLYYRWLLIISLAFSYNLIFIIARFVFDELHVGMAWAPWLFFDIIADLIYIVDIIVKTRTGYLEQGLLVRDSKRIRDLYFKSWEFRCDIFSVLPFDYIVMILIQESFPLGRFFRLLRYPRAIDARERTETRSTCPNIFRINCVITYIVVIIHWNACIYFYISLLLGLGSDAWVYGEQNQQSLPEGMEDTLARRYIYSFYWSTLTLTTIGEVPGPVHNCEYAFVTIDLMCGVLIFATIVGNVGSMISNMSQARADFQQKMDGVKQYMTMRNVSKQLEDRVIRWFDYLWSNKQSLNDEGVLKVLPDKLQAEIAMHVHFETLRKVRIFQDCEAGLLGELVLKLQLQVFSPGDYICRKGDIGREMYIVKRGRLEVVSSETEDAQVFATLQEGSVFGELSILNIRGSKNGNRRTANVRSVGYTDLFVLNKTDLWMALKEYPEARKMLLFKGRELLRKDNLLDEEAAGDQDSPEEMIDEMMVWITALQKRVARVIAEKSTTEEKLNNRIEELEKEIAKYRRRLLSPPPAPRFARRNTLAADFDPHDLVPDHQGTSNGVPTDPKSKKDD